MMDHFIEYQHPFPVTSPYCRESNKHKIKRGTENLNHGPHLFFTSALLWPYNSTTQVNYNKTKYEYLNIISDYYFLHIYYLCYSQ